MEEVELSLDNIMLAYLFDPDEGLKQEVEDGLAVMRSNLENTKATQDMLMGLHAYKDAWQENFRHRARAIEIIEAELIFYEDVWGKVQDSVNKVIRVKGPAPASQVGVYTVGIDWGSGAEG